MSLLLLSLEAFLGSKDFIEGKQETPGPAVGWLMDIMDAPEPLTTVLSIEALDGVLA